MDKHAHRPEQSRELQLQPGSDLEQEDTTERTETPLDKLRLSHRRFVLHYLENGYNSTQAALSAGYTQSTAMAWSIELLKREDIKAAVAWGMEQQGLTRPIIMGQIADIIRNSNIARFIEPYTYKDLQGNEHQSFSLNVLDDEGNIRPGAHLIQQVSIDKDQKVTIKMYSRLEAIDKAAKALGMYSDVTVNNNNLINLNPDLLNQQIEKAKQFALDFEASLLNGSNDPTTDKEGNNAT